MKRELKDVVANTCPHCQSPLKQLSLGEDTILPEDTEIEKRFYRRQDGMSFVVSMVRGGRSKSSLHRPELCLPAQGYTMLNPHNRLVAERPWHLLTLRPPRGGASSVFTYTFFNHLGVRTASHTQRIWQDVWDRSVHNRIDRWVMITIRMELPDGMDERSTQAQAALEKFLTEIGGCLL